ncbi:hypothetical protein [Streptomyces sp. NPDC086182]|jgi:hypothetical protein
MYYTIMLSLIPPVSQHPVQAVICVILIIIGVRLQERPFGCR